MLQQQMQHLKQSTQNCMLQLLLYQLNMTKDF